MKYYMRKNFFHIKKNKLKTYIYLLRNSGEVNIFVKKYEKIIYFSKFA